jgi:osmoprotectant transport system ATP-binding protein
MPPERAVGIQFEHVTFVRGTMEVLRGLDLVIERGETVALVGRSGAGKSTILKLINRMLTADSGEITVSGRRVSEWNPYDLRRHVGYVLQEIALFPHMSVSENVAVVPRLLGWDRSRTEERIGELLELTGLPTTQFAPRRPHELSGGQRQRVGVARALAADPPILLMDEPFGALDPITRSELHRQFRQIQERLRKTIVIVTHDMAEAFALATRIGVLSEGTLVALDTPDAIGRSTDPRVRGLLEPLLEASAALHAANEPAMPTPGASE